MFKMQNGVRTPQQGNRHITLTYLFIKLFWLRGLTQLHPADMASFTDLESCPMPADECKSNVYPPFSVIWVSLLDFQPTFFISFVCCMVLGR